MKLSIRRRFIAAAIRECCNDTFWVVVKKRLLC
jgi:hypothetical protein